MTPRIAGPTPAAPPRARLETDAELQRTLLQLLTGACRRQVWTFLLDESHRIVDPVMPFDELPDDPQELWDVEDLGTVPFIEVFRDRLAMIAELAGASRVVLVWERLGSERFSAEDLEWAGELAASWPSNGPQIRAQFLLHDTGLRQLVADGSA
ncbi:hypothetical protein [Leucobacter sp. gxy201]|uniref:hypothetical protein n=1 Tax=Leucobacter sp. gxy201 TaxID=2957200 RepID=UPI003D9FEA21